MSAVTVGVGLRKVQDVGRVAVIVIGPVRHGAQRGSGGEIQLTDAIEALMEEQPVYTYEFEGVRYDAGTTMGWLQATVEVALQRPDLGSDLREHLRSLDL